MNRLLASLAFSVALAGCSILEKPKPEPVVTTKDLPTIVRVPCPDVRQSAPDLPDDDEDLAKFAADDFFGLAQVYRAARDLYRARLAEDDRQIKACANGG